MISIGLTQTIALLIGPVLPLVTGWITRQDASSGVKAWTLLALSALVSFATALIAAANGGVGFDWLSTLVTVLGTFVAGAGTYLGLWKHVGAAQAVAALPGFIGPVVAAAKEENGGQHSA